MLAQWNVYPVECEAYFIGATFCPSSPFYPVKLTKSQRSWFHRGHPPLFPLSHSLISDNWPPTFCPSFPPKKGEPEDLQVKPETPVFQIKNIVFHALCNRRVPAPSVQRCPSVIEMFLPKIVYPVKSLRAIYLGPWAEMGKHRLLIPKSLKYYKRSSSIPPSAWRFQFS